MKRIGLIVVLLLLAVFTVQAQDATPEATPQVVPGVDTPCGAAALEPIANEESTLDASLTATLEGYLKGMVSQGNGVAYSPSIGGVILLETPEGRYFKSVGVSNIEDCTPLAPNSPYAIGSHTKQFIAAVIYQLQEEGLLSVSDPVSQYLPDEIALFPRSRNATIEQLLTHTSGMPDWEHSENPESLGARNLDPASGSLDDHYTREELIAETAGLQDDPDQPTFAPGEPGNWFYSNTGYVLLGMIIEQVTGQSWIDAVTERILEPLGMDHTVFINEVASPELGLPQSFYSSPFTYDTTGWDYSQADAAGNGISTAEDMAIFIRALYSGELFKDPATLQAMLQPAAPGYPEFNDLFYYMHGGFYQFGWLTHTGGTYGFTNAAGYEPTRDMVAVAWTNSGSGIGGQMMGAFAQALGTIGQ